MSKDNDIQKIKDTPIAWTTENTMLKPKSKVRISFPEETKDVKIFELAQITAPGGLTIEFKLPFPMARPTLMKLADSIKLTGGTVEIQE